MPIVDIFSKRRNLEINGEPDVYSYNMISEKVRVQAVHILRNGFGNPNYYNYDPQTYYTAIHEALCNEYGVFKLHDYSRTIEDEIFNFLLTTQEFDKALDVIELSLRLIDKSVRKAISFDPSTVKLQPDNVIEEINCRFKESGVGYRYESGQMIKIESELIHKELIKPTLRFLSEEKYTNANSEYLEAFEHYRFGRNQDCLVNCLKSFESVMKIICDDNGWAYNQNDTAKKLIDILQSNNLLPSYLQTQFSSFRSVLESGIPTLRNKLGGHGQGVKLNDVEDYIASYALNLTASNIKFLVELDNEFNK